MRQWGDDYREFEGTRIYVSRFRSEFLRHVFSTLSAENTLETRRDAKIPAGKSSAFKPLGRKTGRGAGR